MSLDQLRVQDSERVDRTDLEFLANTPLDTSKELPVAFLTPPAATTINNVDYHHAWVVDGFEPYANGAAADNQLRIDRGTAILSMADGGVVTHGVVSGQGDASRILSVVGYTAGYYAVWIRFELVDAGYSNRLFWDPAAVKEYARNIATRRVANWGMTVTSLGVNPPSGTNQPRNASPGSEWLYVGYFQKRGAPDNDLIVHAQRVLYFEGDEANTYPSTWGAGTDRYANRSAYGVKDLRTFVQAVTKKLGEIQSGTARWWTAPVEPLDQKISRNGDLTMLGNYRFNGPGYNILVDGTLEVDGVLTAAGGLHSGAGADVGINADADGRFSWLYARDINLKDSQVDVQMMHTGTLSKLSMGLSGSATKWGNVYYDSALNTAGTLVVDTSSQISLMLNGTVAWDITNTQVTAHKHVMPYVGTGLSLGSSSYRWHGYFQNAYVGLSLEPLVDAAVTLGTASKQWQLYANDVHVGGLLYGNLIPDTTRNATLGSTSASKSWASLYTQTIYLDNGGGTNDILPKLGQALNLRILSDPADLTVNGVVSMYLGTGGQLNVDGVTTLNNTVAAAALRVRGNLQWVDSGLFRAKIVNTTLIQPAVDTHALELNPSGTDPNTSHFFKFNGVATGTPPYVEPTGHGLPPGGDGHPVAPPGSVYFDPTTDSHRAFVAVQVRNLPGDAWQLRWVELLDTGDLPALVP